MLSSSAVDRPVSVSATTFEQPIGSSSSSSAGRVGETWRSQRWDSFAVNTPNWANGLPGDPYEGDEPDGFYHRDELIDYFEHYAGKFDASGD